MGYKKHGYHSGQNLDGMAQYTHGATFLIASQGAQQVIHVNRAYSILTRLILRNVHDTPKTQYVPPQEVMWMWLGNLTAHVFSYALRTVQVPDPNTLDLKHSGEQLPQ